MANSTVLVFDAGRYYLAVLIYGKTTSLQKALIELLDRTPVAHRDMLGELHERQTSLAVDWLMDQGLEPEAIDHLVIRRRLPFQIGKPPLGLVPQVRAGYLAFRRPFLMKWWRDYPEDNDPVTRTAWYRHRLSR
jgi:hypothetical protein